MRNIYVRISVYVRACTCTRTKKHREGQTYECSRIHVRLRLSVRARAHARVNVVDSGSREIVLVIEGIPCSPVQADETRKRICPYDLRLAVSMQTLHRVALYTQRQTFRLQVSRQASLFRIPEPRPRSRIFRKPEINNSWFPGILNSEALKNSSLINHIGSLGKQFVFVFVSILLNFTKKKSRSHVSHGIREISQ